MNDLPPPTAEGELIRQARDLAIPRLSIRAAAARISMSPEQWGNIERGYRYTKLDNPPRPFTAPAATIAKMARAVGVTSDQLAGARREDAARVLDEILRREGRTAPVARDDGTPDLPPMSPNLEKAMRPHLDEISARIRDASRETPAAQLTGATLFPDSRADRQSWDQLRGFGYTVPQVAAFIAILKADEDEQAGNQAGSGFAAGLDRV